MVDREAAVTPVVGVILLLAIVIILAAFVACAYFALSACVVVPSQVVSAPPLA